jgi:hypothetical protein
MDVLVDAFETGCKAARGVYRYGVAVRRSWVEAFEPLMTNALNAIDDRARQQLLGRPASPVGTPAAGDSPAEVSAEAPDPAPSAGRPLWMTDLIQQTQEWIAEAHALKAIALFDDFIRDYADPALHAHFADNDDNAAEYVRRAIREAVAVRLQISHGMSAAEATFPQHRNTQK